MSSQETAVAIRMQDRERFAMKIEVKPTSDDPCWLWTDRPDKQGYGRFRFPRKNMAAHRVSFLIFNGPIPDNMFVLHRCDNPLCVHPGHLFLGTQTDNMADKKAKGRNLIGSHHQNSRLNEAAVATIKELLRQGMPQMQIARRFNISQTTICHISTGQIWRHV